MGAFSTTNAKKRNLISLSLEHKTPHANARRTSETSLFVFFFFFVFFD